MIILKKALPRRTVLKGLGATLALPLLDAMTPALTAQAETAAAPAKMPAARGTTQSRQDATASASPPLAVIGMSSLDSCRSPATPRA